MPGKVFLVGAGPGAVDLLTLRAASLLRAAEIVLHDDLVPAEILEQCPASAEIVNVGKRCGHNSRSQEQINTLMVWHACETQAQTIVRLKSGDPAVFGRLGEEMEALRRAGVQFEIVPGVTAASAAAASAGITLTDRHAASALMVITAHNVRGEKLRASGIDPQRTSFAVYMPGPDYSRTARDLTDAGVDANTPCLLVSQAGRKSEQKCFLALCDLPFVSGVTAPAILIVGEVARRATGETSKELNEILDPVLTSLNKNPGIREPGIKNPGLNVESSSQS
ncbi:MAG TPA: uroporphyrinogen-III C-methyltransferase [Candidatus Angelobacter sp.]|jgi:uroporphyrin-III C-methyltransferase|nr:uroporphyrinogen-III C-methyltransferase [Candidatus Angelobacter sp.]